jgi:mRNA interferase RelE/StbE
MYKIRFSEKAEKAFLKLDGSIKKKIIEFFDQKNILSNPKSFGKSLLYNYKGNWRYRVGDYRIICRIEEKELLVLVIDVGHRKNIY